MANVQLTPRVLAAYERIDTAVKRLSSAVSAQPEPMDPHELETLRTQAAMLESQNADLKSALESFEGEGEEKITELETRLIALEAEKQAMETRTQDLLSVRDDVSKRLDKLIGDVAFVLSEDEGEG